MEFLLGTRQQYLNSAKGKHMVRLSCAGYTDWFKELFVLGGSDVKLNAVLKKNDEEPN